MFCCQCRKEISFSEACERGPAFDKPDLNTSVMLALLAKQSIPSANCFGWRQMESSLSQLCLCDVQHTSDFAPWLSAPQSGCSLCCGGFAPSNLWDTLLSSYQGGQPSPWVCSRLEDFSFFCWE